MSNLFKQKPNNISANNFSNYSNHKFYDRFINLSNCVFSPDEQKLLEKGFNFNLNCVKENKNLEILGVETELILNKLKLPKHKHNLAGKIEESNGFSKKLDPNLVLVKSIQAKSREIDKEVVFTRADKGKTIIAIDKVDYISKTKDFIESHYFPLNKDPTDEYQKEIKKVVQDSILFDEFESNKITLMNPQAPKLYSFIKLHKENNPIRPVVSFIAAPSTRLSRKLIDIISFHTKFEAKYSIKNSIDLVNKIQDLKLPTTAKLISFDVKNLFPSIPPKEVLK